MKKEISFPNELEVCLKKILKANLILEKLTWKIKLIPILLPIPTTKSPSLYIKIENNETGLKTKIKYSKFYDIYSSLKYIISEIYLSNLKSKLNNYATIPIEDIPFSESLFENNLLGVCKVYMNCILNGFTQNFNLPIINCYGDIEGFLSMQIKLINEEGKENNKVVEDEKNLLGQKLLTFQFSFNHFDSIEDNHSKGLFLEYIEFFKSNKICRTSPVERINPNDENILIEQKINHCIDIIDKEVIEKIQSQKLEIFIYSKEEILKKDKNL